MRKVCINTKQAADKLHISIRQAQRLFKDIRFAYQKNKHQYITIKEFCAYLGIDEELMDL